MINGLPEVGDKRKWYLATPISTKNASLMHKRGTAAARVAGYIMDRQDVKYLICPATHSIPIEQEWPQAVDFPWYKMDEVLFMEQADGMIIANLPGWEKSVGVLREEEWFTQRDKPVYLFDARYLFTDDEWRALEDKWPA
jgi:hypothetical protein